MLVLYWYRAHIAPVGHDSAGDTQIILQLCSQLHILSQNPSLQVFPSIQNSMAAPETFPRVLDCSIAIVAALCSCVGAAGYYMYGNGALDVVRSFLYQIKLLKVSLRPLA